MEWKIGEIKQVNGDWYQCVVGTQGCRECSFRTQDNCKRFSECFSVLRSDDTSVIFKKLEKVGEPYIIGNKLIQRYKIYPTTFNINVYGWYYQNLDVKSWTIDIEIKQNKEGMEESVEEKLFCDKAAKANVEYMKVKLNSSLKPFNLEAAKAGKPVCTRDGRKARIICFDKKCLDGQILIVLVDCGKEECMYFYTTDGKCIDDFSSFDLMMLPKKKEGWVNIYKSLAYSTKEGAIKYRNKGNDYIDTIKISWEE